MNSLEDIFQNFCKYVDERIFSDENVGTYVAFVVDQAFIDEYCKIYSIKESLLMTAVRNSLYKSRRDSLYVKGILAIQLFAASKRANDGLITEKNYYDRLLQVLDWDINELRYWMKTYQEEAWEILYKWCDRHYFQITKCEKRIGPHRYVQYPINQALRVFTEEDLKYVALCFVEKKLSPAEDIQLKDFRRLVNVDDIRHNVKTHHGRLVVEKSITEHDYYNQVFNYFLRWNGEYKEKYGKTINVVKEGIEQLFLYMPDDFKHLELRTASLSLKKKIVLASITYEDFVKSYTFKRNGVILFKRDDVYDNYWQETRYLEGEEEGILVSFIGYDNRYYYKLNNYPIYKTKYIRIYKICSDCNIADFYTSKRFYELYGGLKVGRHTYLYRAAPILKLEYLTKFWIDGNVYESNENNICLNSLSEGHHYIKIKDYKKIEINIVNHEYMASVWMNNYTRWQIDKSKNLWDNCMSEHGSVGLDFSNISQMQPVMDKPLLRRWGNLLTFRKSDKHETNIALRIIKQTEI